MIGVVRQAAKKLPGCSRLRESKIYKRLRHKASLMTNPRENSTFTGFYRLPSQFDALTGPVTDFLREEGPDAALNIIVFGCSNGAEPYTIASVLKTTNPELDFSISAFDIDPEIIKRAQSACYSPESEIYNNRVIPETFVDRTFDRGSEFHRVKESIAKHVRFDLADALDPDLRRKIGGADILFAQNFLFHMKPRIARVALRNLCTLLNRRSALFADGIDLNIREKSTAHLKLYPLDYRLEEIHNEARRARAVGWPYTYWGLEPFMTTSKSWRRRYATIFLRDVARDNRRSPDSVR